MANLYRIFNARRAPVWASTPAKSPNHEDLASKTHTLTATTRVLLHGCWRWHAPVCIHYTRRIRYGDHPWRNGTL